MELPKEEEALLAVKSIQAIQTTLLEMHTTWMIMWLNTLLEN